MKYRFFDKEYSIWRELPDLYGDYQASAYRTYGHGFNISNFLSREAQEKIRDCIIISQQYIGLKDKSGIEVYDGDIIKFQVYEPHDNAIDTINAAEVWYDSEYLSWQFGKFINTNIDPNYQWSYDMSSAIIRESIEVVDNIFHVPIDK